MIHICDGCKQKYLVSEHYRLCNLCGEYLRQRIERLDETDNAESWIVLMSRAMHGEQPRRRRRWRIE